VLFIDSDTAFVKQWGDIIEKNDIEVIKNESGSSALVLAKTYQPNLIVLGLELRDMNGYLVCKRLREDEGTRGIPLFVTSSTATEEDFEKHKKLRVRADEYFRKPVDERVFIKRVSDVLGVDLSRTAKDITLEAVKERRVDEGEVKRLREKIKSMEVEIELLRKDLADEQNSRRELTGKLEMELKEERRKTERVQKEKEELEEQIEVLKKEKQELSSIVDEMERSNKKRDEEFRDKIRTLEKRIKELEGFEASYITLQKESIKYKEEIALFRNEINRWKDKAIQLEEVLKEKDAELSHIDVLTERTRELEDTNVILTQEKEKLEHQLEELRAENASEITSLMDQINTLKEENAKLNQQLTGLKGEINGLRQEINERDEIIRKLNSEKSEFEKQLNDKEQIIREKETIIMDLDQKINSLGLMIEEKEKLIRDKEENINELQKELTRKDFTSDETEKLRLRIQELEGVIAEKEEEILRYKGIEERINELETELKNAKIREEEVKIRLAEMEDLRKKDEEFLNTLDNVVKEKDELLKRVRILEEENMQLKNSSSQEMEKEIFALKAQLSEKEQEIRNLKELIEVQMEEKSALEKKLQEKEEKGKEEFVQPPEEPEKKEEKQTEELLVLDESNVVESKPAAGEDTELVNMLENIWEESGGGNEPAVTGDKPQEAFFEEGTLKESEKIDEFSDDESREWAQMIKDYNSIFNLLFVRLVPEKSRESSEAIWQEFMSEQDDSEGAMFQNVKINDDGTLPVGDVVRNLKKITEKGKIGMIAGLDNLYINQKLKSKLNEFVDFMTVLARKRLGKEESDSLIKIVKEKQKTIK